MVLSCVAFGIYVIPLCWSIPMTVVAFKKMNKGEKLSLAFKICTLLFVNTIAGILMLCDNENN